MKKKILIVEDDAVIRDVLKEHLENDGYDVVTAINGRDAVEVAKNERPNLIIMDIFMPVMDGWEATRIIKSDESLADTQVICLSAYTSPENIDKSREVGCDLILVKPLYPEILKRNVRELLNAQ